LSETNGLLEGIPADIFNLESAEKAFKLAESTAKLLPIILISKIYL